MTEKDKKPESVVEAVEILRGVHPDILICQLDSSSSDLFVIRERLSTGSLTLDKALGGGFVRGSFNEIFGPESSGKSTVALHAIASAQKLGTAVLVDLENSFDPKYAKACGVDLSKLIVAQPDCAEQAFDIIENLAEMPDVSIIVVDSVAGLVPRSEMEGDPGDAQMGLMAKLNRQHLRKLRPVVGRTKVVVLYINQITYKLAIKWGSPETTTGGTGFKYFCGSRIDVRKTSSQKESIEAESIEVKARVVKNRTYKPFEEAIFHISFGKGINRTHEIFDIAVEQGIIAKKGAWYNYNETRLGQGVDNVIRFLSDNETVRKEIYEKLKIG